MDRTQFDELETLRKDLNVKLENKYKKEKRIDELTTSMRIEKLEAQTRLKEETESKTNKIKEWKKNNTNDLKETRLNMVNDKVTRDKNGFTNQTDWKAEVNKRTKDIEDYIVTYVNGKQAEIKEFQTTETNKIEERYIDVETEIAELKEAVKICRILIESLRNKLQNKRAYYSGEQRSVMEGTLTVINTAK